MARIKIRTLPDGTHREAGYFDRAGRWYPADGFVVPGSFQVRSPSRRFPYSYLKHFYTKKYARALVAHKPLLYLELQGLSKDSEEGKQIIAAYAAKRMGVKT